MTSGRSDKLPAGPGQYLCIYATDKPDAWTLKTQSGNDTPAPFGDRQGGQGHQDGGGVQRIYCTVTFPEGDYFFEAVLARQPSNGNSVIYGHLYPKDLSHGFQGEGAVGGWSADRQGDPPIEEE
jgi:hypothetical protein